MGQCPDSSFQDVGHLRTDELIEKAREECEYTEIQFGQVIFQATLPDLVEIDRLDKKGAAGYEEMVDGRTWNSPLTLPLIITIPDSTQTCITGSGGQ
jgi:hypothetical protein